MPCTSLAPPLVWASVAIVRRSTWKFSLASPSFEAGALSDFLGLAEVAQLAPVGSLRDGERTCVHVEAAPPQRKQFAGTRPLGHVQHQQDAIPERYRRQYERT